MNRLIVIPRIYCACNYLCYAGMEAAALEYGLGFVNDWVI